MLYSDILENKSDMQKSLCECRGIFLFLQHWILRKNLLECVESDAHIAPPKQCRFTREVYFLVQPCQNRSAEFARCPRCPPVACQRRWLPLPVLVMLVFKSFLVQVGDFVSYGVCKFAFPGSPLGKLSPQVTEGLPATAASRFHKELRFFFSLLKRKKEAKKEKSSHSTCTTRSSITRRLHINKNPPAGRTGGCCRRNTTLFALEIGA